MLSTKQELGHMTAEKATSIKAKAYVPYGAQVDHGYIGQVSDAKSNKANDQRVQVSLNTQNGDKPSVNGPTESRQNYKY